VRVHEGNAVARLTVGDRSPRSWREVLVATDGSINASRAAEVAARVAGILNARVAVVAVAATHGPPPIVPWAPDPTVRSVPVAEAATWTGPEATRLRARGIDVTEIVLEGNPVDALLAAVRSLRIDLVVVGHHGADGGPTPTTGSVAAQLSQRCPCPLLIVP
jgi:nucleotide-binding universal stress UspA family protein